MLFGLSNPVIALALSVSSVVISSSMDKAPCIRSTSTLTPPELICWSIIQSICSDIGSSWCRWIFTAISVTTSCLQYSLKSSHFSGSWCGRLRVRPPLVFVGLHGTQKYRMSALPVVSFRLSSLSPKASPIAESPAG